MRLRVLAIAALIVLLISSYFLIFVSTHTVTIITNSARDVPIYVDGVFKGYTRIGKPLTIELPRGNHTFTSDTAINGYRFVEWGLCKSISEYTGENYRRLTGSVELKIYVDRSIVLLIYYTL
ncbi:MAG: hypothetical protein QXP91_10400 [Candidatus Methanomethylicia archaeon]